MLTRRLVLAGLIATITALAPLEAYAASWVTLGTRSVSLFRDHDTIRVGMMSGLFTKIRVSVTGNAVFMRDLHVTFANGTGADLPVRFLFLPGTSSRIIDLPGAARLIRRIDMTYRRIPLGGTAVVRVQGYKL